MTIDPGSGQPVGGGQPPEPAESQTSDRLRSMLAQAVEGQRDEQREIAGALGDMRNQLLRLGQEIAQMRATGGSDGTDASTINNVTVELREAVRFLSERLDGVTRMVANRGEELADIRGALTAIDAHVRSQGETIGMLSQGLQALPSYGERVSALHDNVERIQQGLGEVQAAVARPPDNSRLDQRLSSIEGAIAPITDHLAQSRQAAADHSATLADQSATLAEQSAAMAEHRSSLDALHERLESLAAGTQAALAVPPVFDDTSIQALDIQLTALAAQLNALSHDVASLVEAAGTAGGPAAAIDTSEFSAAVAAAEERMSTHVDEAVVALAEMLLRRRMPAPSFNPTETSPSAPSAPVAAADTGSDLPEWWDRNGLTATPRPGVVAEQLDEDQPIVDFSAADFADEDEADDDEADEYETNEHEDEDDDLADEDDLSEAASDEAFEDDYLSPGWDGGAEPADGEAGVAQSAEDLDSTTEITGFDPDAELPDPAPPSESRSSNWSPEVPTERREAESEAPEAEPVGFIVPERKRRWFKG